MRPVRLYLAGNPNSGKTTVFNLLTGLHQHTGNFPGVTVERKRGHFRLDTGEEVEVIDLPGTYSFYPTSLDERIVVQHFADPDREAEFVLYIADMNHLDKHFLLLEQIMDTGARVILALNMADQAERHRLDVDVTRLRHVLRIPVIKISARTGAGLAELKQALHELFQRKQAPPGPFYKLSDAERRKVQELQKEFAALNDYQRLLLLHHYRWLPFLSEAERERIAAVAQGFDSLKHQVEETMQRYNRFLPVIRSAIRRAPDTRRLLSDRLDSVLTHRVWGPLIFFAIVFMVFQAIFSWAAYPMEWIDGLFSQLANIVRSRLPAGWFRDLLADGVIAGLGGIVIFVPQIAILFFLLGILEEIGYMARAVYLFDSLMQRFGLNGRSIVSLISGGACAIPAIMTTRTITNWKERLTTILTVPFISCSARLPVYVILVGMAVPETHFLIFNLQGLAFAGLYLLGVIAALGAGWVLKHVLHTGEQGFLALQLPSYQWPVWRNVFLGMWEKTRSFVLGAGKIILVISIVLWAAASFGPPGQMKAAAEAVRQEVAAGRISPERSADALAARRLEASYAGRVGKWIEPLIRPLGYDWRIGIGLLTSFAAREVFVGTMSTLYSLGDDGGTESLREKMRQARLPDGRPVFTRATSLSLLIFYVFAMQCMSTLAVVRRETGSWKWPALQFTFMTTLAYLAAWAVYHLLSSL